METLRYYVLRAVIVVAVLAFGSVVVFWQVASQETQDVAARALVSGE